MTLVAVAWIYVVLLMAVAEAMSPQGTLLGAIFTFVLYGLLPLGIVLYIMATPARRKQRQRAEAAEMAAAAEMSAQTAAAAGSAPSPDGGGHAPGDAIAAEREKR